MTAPIPKPPQGTFRVLTRTGTTLHDAFIGSKRSVCGGLIARTANTKHLQRLRMCRRCVAFRRAGLQ